jgi:mannose-6-phosphate isomerase-like protein (cupin superfamily)
MVDQLYKHLKNQTVNYDNFLSGNLRVVGLPAFLRADSVVKDHFTYAEWIAAHHSYPVVKVEGLEQVSAIRKRFTHLKPVDIHLFVAQQTGYSFKWHWDHLNVFLYVVRGYKRVQLKNKVIELHPGQGVFIPRRHLHRVMSKKNTWALSVGFK